MTSHALDSNHAAAELAARLEADPEMAAPLLELTDLADSPEKLRQLAARLKSIRVPDLFEERCLATEGGEILIRAGKLETYAEGTIEVLVPRAVSLLTAPRDFNLYFRAEFPELGRDAVCERDIPLYEADLSASLRDCTQERRIRLQRMIPDTIDLERASGIDVLGHFKMPLPSPIELALCGAAYACVYGDADFYSGYQVATSNPRVVLRTDPSLGITFNTYARDADMSFAVAAIGVTDDFAG